MSVSNIFRDWIWGSGEGEEKPRDMKNCIKANYSEEHLEKWEDVWNGKYFLSVSNDCYCQEIFKFDGKWYMNIERQGDGSNYYAVESEQMLIALFLNPHVSLHPFDYHSIREKFDGKIWTNAKPSEEDDGMYDRFGYYYLDGKMVVDQRLVFENEVTVLDMSSDDIGKFVNKWIHFRENYRFENYPLPLVKKEEEEV